MSILKKEVIICNRCKRITDGDVNLVILGEKFSLCEDCLNGILDYLTAPKEPIVQSKIDKPRADKKEILPLSYSEPEKRSSYTQWDQYKLEKLVSLRKQGKAWHEIASVLCVTTQAVNGIVYRIRQAKPGYDLYSYKKALAE